MCGATGAQTELQNEQMQFYRQATQEASTAFSEQQALLKNLQDVYNPILAKGPNQEGFSDAELKDLNATAIDQTAQNYKGAAKAVNEQLAAEGGGDLAITTGGQAQLKAEVAASSAAQESAEEGQIKQADYAQGYDEFKQATQALSVASGQLSPVSYNSAANDSGSAASKTANDIAAENNSWINAAIGAAGSIGGAVTAAKL